ncbi:MAG TPA: PhnD/SsuA/transferrin family substrate-binding protein [Polyangiaceae bacterium]
MTSPAPPSASRELLVFGYSAHAQSEALRRRMSDFATALGAFAGLDITVSPAESYDQLARRVHKKTFDLAWMPPIPYIALQQKKSAVPLVTLYRSGSTQFHAAIIVRSDARVRTPQGLKGKRAAWVDQHSAAGFVLPRVQLAALGVDPRTAFGEERFYGSHEAVVRAVVGGRADFGATYARLDRSGDVVNGAWADLPGAEGATRVLSTFGMVPNDVVVARADLPQAVREQVVRGLLAICHDVNGGLLVRDLFGVHEFRRWTPASYEALRGVASDALAEGLLDTKKILRG